MRDNLILDLRLHLQLPIEMGSMLEGGRLIPPKGDPPTGALIDVNGKYIVDCNGKYIVTTEN